MTTKETTVLIIGFILVGFLYLMKHPLHEMDLLDAPTNQPVGIGVLASNRLEQFNPETETVELDTILDVPAWEMTEDNTELKTQSNDELIASIEQAISDERYFQPEQDNALFYLIRLKAIETDESKYASYQQQIKQRLLALTQVAIAKSDAQQLTNLIAKLKTIDSEQQNIKTLEQQLATVKTINKLYTKGMQQISNNVIVSADSNDAWHTAKQSQELDANNPKTIQLLVKVNEVLIENALLAAQESDYNLAATQIQQAKLLTPKSEKVIATIKQIAQLKQQRYLWLEQQISKAISNVNIPRAETMLQQLANLGLQQSQLQEYQSEINRMQIYGKYHVLEEFSQELSDGSQTPKMVVMPTGRYVMGSNKLGKYQKPQHLVNIDYGFAVSQNEISVAQFKQFIQATNYRTDADKNRKSKVYEVRTGHLKNKRNINWKNNYLGKKAKDNEPVIHISWNDAQAYVKWLTAITGKPYRLLSEAEFEYILRATSTSLYPWGEGTPKSIIENLPGQLDRFEKNSRVKWAKGFENYGDGYFGIAPVGSFILNQFRLNDTAGNVMEWVADCWHDSYVRAPIDGTPWLNSGCQDHVIRGGSWSSAKSDFISSHRFKAKATFTDARLGFRIALDLK